MKRKKITLPNDLVAEWTSRAEAAGYGVRGRNKYLRVLFLLADEFPRLVSQLGKR
jgi:hypothetical protein